MKNKIFLTSMFAVMLAFPAYATLVNDPDAQHQSGTIASTSSSESCDSDPLTYQGTTENYGTYTLTAQWNVDQCTIELDPNVANGGASSNADPFATLYTTYDVGAYKDSARTNLMSTNSNGLSSAPIGKTVTLTTNTNNPNSTNNITVVGGTLSGQLPFNGFFSAATGGTQYISQTNPYYILSAGDTAAKNLDSGGTGSCSATWYAQYGCFQTTLPVLNKPGYTFDGWWTDAVNGTSLNDGDAALCLTADSTVYAHWSPDTCNLVYHATTYSTDPSANSISSTATYDSAYSVPGTAGRGTSGSISEPASGYSWAGWTTDSNPTFTNGTLNNEWTWTDGTVWTNTSATCPIDLYAAYTANQYTVTYDCNGGSFKSGIPSWTGSSSGVDVATYDSTLYSSLYRTPYNTCERTDYNLDSNATWTCTKTVNGTTSSETYFANVATAWNKPYNMNCSITWPGELEYKIIYECGAFPDTNTPVYSNLTTSESYYPVPHYGDSWSLLATPPTSCTSHASGYYFVGWWCDKSDINTCTGAGSYAGTENYSEGASGNSYGCHGDVICRAVWGANSVNIIWEDDNDPSNNVDTPHSGGANTCQYGATGVTFGVPSTAPTKIGHTFTGWKVTNWSGGSSNNN